MVDNSISGEAVPAPTQSLRWIQVPNGFLSVQTDLKHEVGLFGAKLGDSIMYIGTAVQVSNGGLSAGLARPRCKNASGDTGYGMKMIREHLTEVEAFVLCVPPMQGRTEYIQKLKVKMIERYAPPWNQSKKRIRNAREAFYRERAL